MKRVLICLTIGILFVLSGSFASPVMAQVIKPLGGTKGANAINDGVGQFNRGNMNKALTQFQSALKTNPRSAVAHYNLALTYNRMGQSDKATKHFQEAEKLGRGNPFIQHSSILKQHLKATTTR